MTLKGDRTRTAKEPSLWLPSRNVKGAVNLKLNQQTVRKRSNCIIGLGSTNLFNSRSKCLPFVL